MQTIFLGFTRNDLRTGELDTKGRVPALTFLDITELPAERAQAAVSAAAAAAAASGATNGIGSPSGLLGKVKHSKHSQRSLGPTLSVRKRHASTSPILLQHQLDQLVWSQAWARLQAAR